MKKSIQSSLVALGLFVGAVSPALSATTILDNFEDIRVVTFAARDTTAGVIASGALELSRSDNQGFQQYADAFLGRENAALSALQLADATLHIDISALAINFSDNFNVRFIVNSDALPDSNYQAFGLVTVIAGADRLATLSIDLAANPSIAASALNYQSGGGTYFGFILDNDGWNNSASSLVFSIDNIRVETAAIPEPSSLAALGGLAVLGCADLRRRR